MGIIRTFRHPFCGQPLQHLRGGRGKPLHRTAAALKTQLPGNPGDFFHGSNGPLDLIQIRIALPDKGNRQAVRAVNQLRRFAAEVRHPLPNALRQTRDILRLVRPFPDLGKLEFLPRCGNSLAQLIQGRAGGGTGIMGIEGQGHNPADPGLGKFRQGNLRPWPPVTHGHAHLEIAVSGQGLFQRPAPAPR